MEAFFFSFLIFFAGGVVEKKNFKNNKKYGAWLM
jgi:hypothetical protein